MVLSAWLHQHLGRFADGVRLLAVIVGVAVCIGSTFISQQQSASVFSEEQLGRHLGRIVWCLAMQFPWIVAACFSIADSSEYGIRTPDWKTLATGLLIVFVVPICYVEFVVDRQLGIFHGQREQLQVSRAWKSVRRLNAMGTKAWTNDFTEKNERNQLQQTELELARELGSIYRFLDSQELTAASSDDEKINYALQLSKLAGENIDRDYLSDAIEVLQQDNLVHQHPRAALIMGSIREHQSEYAQAVDHYSKVIELATSPNASPDTSTLFIGYERLANNLRRIGRGQEAEQLLLDAKKKFPEQAIIFDYQLGLHYELAGRPIDAIEFYQTIPVSTPRFGVLAESRRSNIEQTQLGCRIGVSR